MASVHLHGKTYRAQFKGPDGSIERRVTPFTKGQKKEALAFARDLESRFLRARSGAEPAPIDPTRTFGWLYSWWWERYGSKRRGRSKGEWDAMMRSRVVKHLADVKLTALTPLAIETVLKMNEGEVGPKTLNDLRGTLHTVFERASIRGGPWSGPNPIKEVPRWKKGKRVKDALRADEVPLMLQNLEERWRPLFATALWMGLRKGELAAMKKSSVSIRNPGEETMKVLASWDAEMTKNEDQDVLPIPSPLVPYLRQALAASTSDLLFPGPSGGMMSEDTKLQMVLRRALARAGLVEGWVHTCRRCKSRGAPHVESHEDDKPRQCPVCDMRLWPKPVYRRITFHGLRHSTATLLARAGVPTAIAQRILRHSDIEMTAAIYTDVDLGDMRQAMNRLLPAEVISSLPAVEPARIAVGAHAEPQGLGGQIPLESQASESPKNEAPGVEDFSCNSGGFEGRGDRIRTCDPLVPNGLVRGNPRGYVGGSEGQPGHFTEVAPDRGDLKATPYPPVWGKKIPLESQRNGAPSGATRAPLRALPTALLSVRDVAAALGVSTPLVYRLVESGELAHVRVSNAIRVERSALDRYLATQRGGGKR
jgi:integrase